MFLARTVPASRSAKPHCMKKTRKPHSISQKVSACVAPKYGADATAVEIIEATSVELSDMSARVCKGSVDRGASRSVWGSSLGVRRCESAGSERLGSPASPAQSEAGAGGYRRRSPSRPRPVRSSPDAILNSLAAFSERCLLPKAKKGHLPGGYF